MNKKRLIELANQLQYAELFEELAKLDLNISKRGLVQLSKGGIFNARKL